MNIANYLKNKSASIYAQYKEEFGEIDKLNSDNEDLSDVSLFDEFINNPESMLSIGGEYEEFVKDYLMEHLGTEVDLDSMDFDDVLDLEVDNGSIVNPYEEDEIEEETQEEAQEVQKTKDLKHKNNPKEHRTTF